MLSNWEYFEPQHRTNLRRRGFLRLSATSGGIFVLSGCIPSLPATARASSLLRLVFGKEVVQAVFQWAVGKFLDYAAESVLDYHRSLLASDEASRSQPSTAQFHDLYGARATVVRPHRLSPAVRKGVRHRLDGHLYAVPDGWPCSGQLAGYDLNELELYRLRQIFGDRDLQHIPVPIGRRQAATECEAHQLQQTLQRSGSAGRELLLHYVRYFRTAAGRNYVAWCVTEPAEGSFHSLLFADL
ncbi:MAG: hypothetical protein RLZZ458_1691 [Planctomycetota bacterium]